MGLWQERKAPGEDVGGNIVWRARYAAWGKVVFENVTGAAPDSFEQNLRMHRASATTGKRGLGNGFPGAQSFLLEQYKDSYLKIAICF